MKPIIAVAIFLLFLSQVVRVNGDASTVSKEIDRIVITENSRIIYYKDGSKEMTIALSSTPETLSFASIGTIKPPSISIDIQEILKKLADIAETIPKAIGVGSLLLAYRIWNIIKGLRHNRPKDYDGVSLRNSVVRPQGHV